MRPYTTSDVALSSVAQVMVEVAEAVVDAMDEMTGPVLSTVKETADDVARLFEVSRATATMDFVPLEVAVLSQVTPYGDEVSSEPMMAPPILNVTPATATSSDAFAVRDTEVPLTVAPFVGAVTETVGGVVSGVLLVVKVWSLAVAVLPLVSVETTAKW